MYLSFAVIQPFLNALLSGVVISYVVQPAYKFLNKKLKSPNLSAFIISLFIILLILTPLVLIIDNVAPEARYSYIRAKQKILSGELIDIDCRGKASMLCTISGGIKKFVSDPEIKPQLQETLSRVTTYAIEKTSELFLSLPRILLNIFITFFVIFYLLKDGDALTEKVKRLLPLRKKHQEHIFNRLKDTTYAVLYGSIVVAIVQGALGALGFYIFGIASPVTWGLVMTIMALVPIVGTAIVWLPASLLVIGEGLTLQNNLVVWQGIGLFLYSFLIVGTIDNILKPRIIGERSGVHPILIMFGALGGLAIFGMIGFIIGPLILAIFSASIEIYEEEREELG
ncbi:AI-2E family transporter, partial [Candidatus Woesearchaeota archaeon]|nr:AI-2E family transporter [Candidatus Woesearchaeota archaeon]